MGGFGSGRWQQGKPLTTQRKRLDIRELQREALGLGYASLQWRDATTAWITFHEAGAPVETRLPGQPTQHHTIELDKTPLKFGGHRVWWRCPCCSARVGQLYWEGRWACRKCAGLMHESTRQTEDSLAFARVDKIRKKLGWGGGMCSPFERKPKGMHLRTFARLMQELTEAMMLAAGASSDRMDMLVGRLKKFSSNRGMP